MKTDQQTLEQRDKILLSIAEKHSDDKGHIRLSKAFEEEPMLQSQLAALGLDTGSRLNAYVLAMRRRGTLKSTSKHSAPGFTKKKVAKRQKPWGEAQISLVHHVARTYKKPHAEGVSWEKAFEEHPDWAKLLGGYSKKTMSAVYRALRKKDPKIRWDNDEREQVLQEFEQQQNGNGVHEPVALTAPAEVPIQCAICGFVPSVPSYALLCQHYATKHNKPPKAPPPEPLPFNFCPKCGTNLLLFVTAFKVADKHSHGRGGE